MDWKEGKLTKAVIHSKSGGICRIKYNNLLRTRGLKKTKEANVYSVNTKAGEDYILR
jgi:hypothetical protein